MHWLSNLFAEVAALTVPQVGVVGSTVGLIYEVTRAGQIRLYVDRLLWRRMDMMAVNAQAMYSYAIRLKFPPDRLTVVLNGVDIPDDAQRSPVARAAAREHLGVAPDAPLIGMIARLDPVKDYPTFLRAAQLVAQHSPDARFAVIGGGTEQAALEALASNLGIHGAVIFTGELPSVASVLPALDVAVLCSLHEGLPNALLEAGVWGLPLIATPVGGSPEIVLDGQTGYLTPVGDAEALAAHLLALLADPLQRQRLGQAAREYISQRFSMAAMISAYEMVYQQVAERRQARGKGWK